MIMDKDYYVVLVGGVGAAKFIEGLVKVVKPEQLVIIINTGDDIELFGLKICPDIDIITYTLAGVVDPEKQWGFKNESFNALEILEGYYGFRWFNAGDKDLATHIYRTDLFNRGYNKAEITKIICEKLNVKSQLIPMSNEEVQTYITTPQKTMHFEEYFIKDRCESDVLDVEFRNIENAEPVEGVIDLISDAKKIIICPSNPIVSIGTILNIKGIKSALEKVKEKVYAISPIVQGAPIKGPADKLMRSIGLSVSCVGVALFYKDVVSHIVIGVTRNVLFLGVFYGIRKEA